MKWMDRGWVIALGVLATVFSSFVGLVVLPEAQLRQFQPVESRDGSGYPTEAFGDRLEGRREYVGLGCVYCHSQQVRPSGFGADIERGWGMRQSDPTDYLGQSPILLGTSRTGPDLANIGARQPSRQWHYLHLYDPQLTSPGSNMAPFPFLFDLKPKTMRARDNYLEFPESDPRHDQYWLVPTPRAERLVTYLLSLDQSLRVES